MARPGLQSLDSTEVCMLRQQQGAAVCRTFAASSPGAARDAALMSTMLSPAAQNAAQLQQARERDI